MSSISFELVLSPVDQEIDPPARYFHVRAVIEGVRLGSPSVPVDFFSLLALRGLTCEQTVLTCSCGVPECAGFHHPVLQHWSAKTVTWTLDAKEYGRYFAAARQASIGGKLHLVFDTLEFERALDHLRCQFESAFEEGPLLQEHDDPEAVRLTSSSLHETLVRMRQLYDEDQGRREWESRVFADFERLQVRAGFPNAKQCVASLSWILLDHLWDEARERDIEGVEETNRFIEEQVQNVWAPLLKASPSALLAFVHRQSWSTARRWFDVSAPAWPALELGLSDQELWQRARLVLEPAAS